MKQMKPWTSFADQLELLKSRGMEVSDEEAALRNLERIGYYRLSAYWYPFRIWQFRQEPCTGQITHQRTDQFMPGTRFVDALDLYLFDKKLRLSVLDVLERIEIALRVDVAYCLGERNALAHLKRSELHSGFSGRFDRQGKAIHQSWCERHVQLVARSREDFVSHYHAKHGPDLPIWVAVELWDFGSLSQLFAMMKVADQQRIASKYGVSDWKVFQSWLRSLSYLRNVCAHHGRLWNRNVVEHPKLAAVGDIAWCDVFASRMDLRTKPFMLLSICRHLVRCICPGTEWPSRVRHQLEVFPSQQVERPRSIADMGTPPGWEEWW